MQIFSGAFGLGAAALGLATEAICLGAVLTTGRGVIPALAPVTIIFRVPLASGSLKSVLGMRATTGISYVPGRAFARAMSGTFMTPTSPFGRLPICQRRG